MKEDTNTDVHESESESMNDWHTSTVEWNEHVSPVAAIVEAVAGATNRDPVRLPPLYEYVDTDALDTLVTSGTDGLRESVSVTFPYESHTVLVENTGTIEITFNTADPE